MGNPPNKVRWLALAGVACLALAVRLPGLGDRPLHTDESVNAYITGQLLAGESFHYDPQDRHGPVLYVLAYPAVRLAGAHTFADLTEPMLRIVPAIAGALAIFLFAPLVRQIGLTGTLLAALLFAIGPLPAYYSRYYIHETLFVAATLGLLCTGWRALTERSAQYAAMAGFWAAVMLACKETALLHFAAMGGAVIWWFNANRRGGSAPTAWRSWLIVGASAFVAFMVVLLAAYSWGGRHWQGLSDLAGALPLHVARAGGQGHEKPFWYYLVLLAGGWSGWLVLLLALIGSVAVLLGLSPRGEAEGNGPILALRTLLVYAVLITAIYSAIPYKTPWLALNLWLPMAILAGCGFVLLSHTYRWRLLAGVCALTLLLAHDTRQRVFVQASDPRNPYAYAHTVEDVLRLPGLIAKFGPNKPADQLRIAVVAKDPWPLPWYLRKFPQVGFWQPEQDPGPADVYITSLKAAGGLTARLENRRPEYVGIRPEVPFIVWLPQP